MKGKEVKKFVGCSWVYMENGVIVFIFGDIVYFKLDVIYFFMVCLVVEINYFVLVERFKE